MWHVAPVQAGGMNKQTRDLRIGIMVGLLGGFTTFSSYCLDSSRLFETSEWPKLAAYFILSPLLVLAGTFSGLYLTRALLRG